MDRFEELLHPVTKESFLADHWDRRFLHISADDAAKFRDYPDLADLPAMLGGEITPGRWSAPPQTANASYIDAEGKTRSLSGMPVSVLNQLYNSGFSLCFLPLDHTHPVLKALSQSLQTHTQLPSDNFTTCYLTPPNSGGGMHFDCQHVFFCQVSGEKHWKVSSRTAMYAPPLNFGSSQLRDPQTKAMLQHMGIDLVAPRQLALPWLLQAGSGDDISNSCE